MSDLQKLQKQMGYKETFHCVQCGYCLPVCPTYKTMGKETHSPRGRITLVKLAAEGKIDLQDLRDPIDKCLDCRACVTACPTNVQYGKIVEGAKEALADHEPASGAHHLLKKMIFQKLFPHPSRLQVMGHFLWAYQKLGFQKLARKIKLTNLLPAPLAEFESILPKISSPGKRSKSAQYVAAQGEKKVRVGFFRGCLMDTLFHQTNQRTIQLLVKAGAEVVLPDFQTCCGALHAHAGQKKEARELAKQNIEAFEKEDVEYVIHNAGGCGAMLLEYEHLFEDDAHWKKRAQKFAKSSRDISQILTELDGLTFTKEVQEVVTYQSSCHLTHVQKVVDQPVQLLKEIPGIDYRPMKEDQCCGSADIYNLVNYNEAMEILDLKMSFFESTQATTIVTTNPGCLLQMKLGLKRENVHDQVRVVHLVDLLTEAEPVSLHSSEVSKRTTH